MTARSGRQAAQRASLFALTLGALLAAFLPAAAHEGDGIRLTAVPGLVEGDVDLSWTGGAPPFRIYRATTAAGVLAPDAALLGQTDGRTWTDTPPAGSLFFYHLTGIPCSPTGPEVCDGIDNDCDGAIDGPGSEASCDLPQATPVCRDGACAIASCQPGFADCDGFPITGCEADLSTDTANCGACGVACANPHGSTSCQGGSCAPVCDAGWGDCNASRLDGCETSLTTNDNCGACGAACAPPGGTGTCASGSCQVASCQAGLADCNGLVADGCEAPLNTLQNCGGCGRVCNLANASESCSTGTCQVLSCDAGWGNCNGVAADGCETPLNTLQNCGGCGRVCNLANASESCAAGTCTLVSCNPGFGNCNASPADGCETPLTTLQNCGQCGIPCNLPNANESCSTGTCTLTSCLSGFANCDANNTNGCEVALSSSSNSCSAPEVVGTYCGDVTCGFLCPASPVRAFTSRSGIGSRWFQARASECSSCCADVEHRLTLYVPASFDYDLYVYSPCGLQIGSSTLGTGQTERLTIFKGDDCLGTDDSFFYWVEIRYYSGASCSTWTLTFEGRNC